MDKQKIKELEREEDHARNNLKHALLMHRLGKMSSDDLKEAQDAYDDALKALNAALES